MSISPPIQRESPQEVCLLCDLTILCLFTKNRGHICPRTCSFLRESVHPLGKNWRSSSCKMYRHGQLGLLHEGWGPSLWILKRLMVHKLRHLLCHKRGCDICSTVTYYSITTVAFIAYCLQNRDKQRYAVECPNHNQHVVWTLHQVAESVFGCILQYNYRFVAYCLRNHDERRDAAKQLTRLPSRLRYFIWTLANSYFGITNKVASVAQESPTPTSLPFPSILLPQPRRADGRHPVPCLPSTR
jgi:hypothetical protein